MSFLEKLEKNGALLKDDLRRDDAPHLEGRPVSAWTHIKYGCRCGGCKKAYAKRNRDSNAKRPDHGNRNRPKLPKPLSKVRNQVRSDRNRKVHHLALAALRDRHRAEYDQIVADLHAAMAGPLPGDDWYQARRS